ncbi:MAG: hypothetical protein IPF96_21785, partial [Rhodobacter sp.]|nr:hypothetical protein [Rhodobacter sp.]
IDNSVPIMQPATPTWQNQARRLIQCGCARSDALQRRGLGFATARMAKLVTERRRNSQKACWMISPMETAEITIRS